MDRINKKESKKIVRPENQRKSKKQNKAICNLCIIFTAIKT